jgi:hypothetical protein
MQGGHVVLAYRSIEADGSCSSHTVRAPDSERVSVLRGRRAIVTGSRREGAVWRAHQSFRPGRFDVRSSRLAIVTRQVFIKPTRIRRVVVRHAVAETRAAL